MVSKQWLKKLRVELKRRGIKADPNFIHRSIGKGSGKPYKGIKPSPLTKKEKVKEIFRKSKKSSSHINKYLDKEEQIVSSRKS